ncbi:MAG: hydroxymethylbilane synthase, partial [Acidimicrobiales bacterium]|nr:hydroxymethylbilane synthase [Acidimicrobiales bacterium]
MNRPAVRLRLATRGSPLARRQADRVAERLAARGVETSVVVVETEGDRRSTVPIDRLGGRGVFVREVQLSVLHGEADAAVHSAKDLPASDDLAAGGLVIAAIPERADPRDLLVGSTLHGLPAGATVAT